MSRSLKNAFPGDRVPIKSLNAVASTQGQPGGIRKETELEAIRPWQAFFCPPLSTPCTCDMCSRLNQISSIQKRGGDRNDPNPKRPCAWRYGSH